MGTLYRGGTQNSVPISGGNTLVFLAKTMKNRVPRTRQHPTPENLQKPLENVVFLHTSAKTQTLLITRNLTNYRNHLKTLVKSMILTVGPQTTASPQQTGPWSGHEIPWGACEKPLENLTFLIGGRGASHAFQCHPESHFLQQPEILLITETL